MSDPQWREFVASFCLQRDMIFNDAVARLRQSDYYILAHRTLHCGGSEADVTRLLEQARDEVN